MTAASRSPPPPLPPPPRPPSPSPSPPSHLPPPARGTNHHHIRHTLVPAGGRGAVAQRYAGRVARSRIQPAPPGDDPSSACRTAPPAVTLHAHWLWCAAPRSRAVLPPPLIARQWRPRRGREGRRRAMQQRRRAPAGRAAASGARSNGWVAARTRNMGTRSRGAKGCGLEKLLQKRPPGPSDAGRGRARAPGSSERG